MRTPRRTRFLDRTPIRALALSLAAVGLFAPDADARGRKYRSHRGFSPVFTESYTALKAGGYDLDTLSGDESLDGLFLGLEWGVSPSPYVELGLSVDWLRRRQGNEQTLVVDSRFELPVNGVVAVDGTSTDLVPMGALVRLRFPVAQGQFVPFLAGHLTYDVLRLEYHQIQTSGGVQFVDEQDQYFYGIGATISVGVEAKLDHSFGLLAELGVHQSDPSRDLEIDGIPIRGEVDAGGGFARLGMRFGFH